MKPIKSSIKPIPTKLGTVQTVNMNTGEVTGEKKNAMTMLPPPPSVCQECAVDHKPEYPHNQQSLAYQYYFYARHGRWPTWTDAMAHCTDEEKAYWRKELVEEIKKNGMPVPDDLIERKTAGR
jgi:hypothetical protein